MFRSIYFDFNNISFTFIQIKADKMKSKRLFQRFMITLLLGINAFVFMSMRGFSMKENLLYTAGLVTSIVILITLIQFLQKRRIKKSIHDT
jgi:H+/Cl- antiporter ClcA